MKPFFVYKKPALALAAVASLLFIFVLNILPWFGMDHVDKFGFLMGMGVAVYFLVVAGKAVRNEFKNLSALLFTSALLMALIGVVLTSPDTLAASALEDMTVPLIGGIGGYFTGVEDTDGRP